MGLALPTDDAFTASSRISDWQTGDGFESLTQHSESFEFVKVGPNDEGHEKTQWAFVLESAPHGLIEMRENAYFKTLDEETVPVVSEGVEFSALVRKWHTERGETSSSAAMSSCPSYLRIIGMGFDALPMIFAQLRSERDDPDHWFVALEAITGHDPIPDDAYGNTVRMSDAWLSWADARGY